MGHGIADGKPGLACGPQCANCCSPVLQKGCCRGVPALLPPNNLLQMKIYGHHPRLTESESLRRRARNLHLNKLPTISTYTEVWKSELWRNLYICTQGSVCENVRNSIIYNNLTLKTTQVPRTHKMSNSSKVGKWDHIQERKYILESYSIRINVKKVTLSTTEQTQTRKTIDSLILYNNIKFKNWQ